MKKRATPHNTGQKLCIQMLRTSFDLEPLFGIRMLRLMMKSYSIVGSRLINRVYKQTLFISLDLDISLKANSLFQSNSKINSLPLRVKG